MSIIWNSFPFAEPQRQPLSLQQILIQLRNLNKNLTATPVCLSFHAVCVCVYDCSAHEKRWGKRNGIIIFKVISILRQHFNFNWSNFHFFRMWSNLAKENSREGERFVLMIWCHPQWARFLRGFLIFILFWWMNVCWRRSDRWGTVLTFIRKQLFSSKIKFLVAKERPKDLQWKYPRSYSLYLVAFSWTTQLLSAAACFSLRLRRVKSTRTRNVPKVKPFGNDMANITTCRLSSMQLKN